ncbi:hypothetical protein DPMN_075258 [Dreissena polymorpha]|uniref:Uncharacterized protein n=1 Tax=Dreissena polymorpha TaxID=45954 RepID=A0A9D3YK55_DREPO|nr:hypothetical protein DPMN_075258 [Dreissena polymorpha]
MAAIEVRQFHQYVVRVDGTDRVTLRNRQHLRKFSPFFSNSTDSLVKTFESQRPKSTYLTHEHAQHPQLLPAPSALEEAISNATQEPALPPPQPTQDPVVETDTPPPTEDVQPELSAPTNTGGTKIPRALARLLPHNTPGEKELLPPNSSMFWTLAESLILPMVEIAVCVDL